MSETEKVEKPGTDESPGDDGMVTFHVTGETAARLGAIAVAWGCEVGEVIAAGLLGVLTPAGRAEKELHFSAFAVCGTNALEIGDPKRDLVIFNFIESARLFVISRMVKEGKTAPQIKKDLQACAVFQDLKSDAEVH